MFYASLLTENVLEFMFHGGIGMSVVFTTYWRCYCVSLFLSDNGLLHDCIIPMDSSCGPALGLPLKVEEDSGNASGIL